MNHSQAKQSVDEPEKIEQIPTTPQTHANSILIPNDAPTESQANKNVSTVVNDNTNNQLKSTEFQAWSQIFALDILDKQYRLYSWNDAKSTALITTNSMLLAAIGFLFKECLQDTLATIFITFALLLTCFSLYFSLKQVIPQGSSGKSGKKANLRALSGISVHKTLDEYLQAFTKYTNQEAITDTVRQIYGMSHNNENSRRSITTGVHLTMASIVFIFLSAMFVAVSVKGINIFGKWTPEIVSSKVSDSSNFGKTTLPPNLHDQTKLQTAAPTPLMVNNLSVSNSVADIRVDENFNSQKKGK